MRNFFKTVIVALCALFIVAPGFANMGNVGDIGDYGRWATEHNHELVNARIVDELHDFGPTQTTVPNSFVPIDAKIGLAFMAGMSKVGTALDSSLVRFAIMFMLLAYAFWVAFEAYQLIGSGTDAKKVVQDILKKGIVISVWLIILKFGIVQTFSIILIPIVELGNALSHIIWESVTAASGFSMPDNCAAIKEYAQTNLPDSLNMSSDTAAGLLCIPSQMSAFFVTTMGIGWKWVISNVGVSLFGFAFGGYITYLSLKSLWKYLFISLGVVADIFLALLLLPFTAIAETTAKTKYKGIAGDIFNSFLDIFKAEKLSVQINRVIKATIYFVFFAVAVGVSLSLLTFIIDPETGRILSYQNSSGLSTAIVLVLTLLLVCYMADKAEKFAADWGGKLDSGLGNAQKDISKLWGISKDNVGKFIKRLRNK